MNLERTVQTAWTRTRENFKRKRYLAPGNYLTDVLAGNVSRTPLYAIMDTILVGASPEKALASAIKSVEVSLCGYSLAYIMGNSMLAESLGEFYARNKKKVDATYSAITTFGFGMGVNLAAGYTPKQALAASSLRAALAVPLGPVTRFYSDAFREVRGEPSITPQGTPFHARSAAYAAPRIAAMILVPLALMYGALSYTKEHRASTPQPVAHQISPTP